VRPRKQKGRGSGSNSYAYELVVVSLVDKTVVSEDGYEQFPYHIVRWAIGDEGSQWGYGQGAVALSSSKELQIQRRALILCGELSNNPPRETLASFEGTPKVYPGANNRVMEAGSIRALDRALQGNFPITKETIEMTKEDIHRAFFVKVFAPLDNLPGDRRTTVEIIERVKAGYMRLVLPTTRLYNEGLTPIVERSVLQLLKYRILEPPPAELGEFKVEYLGRLALALKEQQSDALQRFGQFAMSMEQVLPNFTSDNINVDRAGRRMAQTFGVAETDLNTEEERIAIREQRNQQQQSQMAMMAAESAGKAYKSASGKAEEGSPAEELMAQAG
jgi:hypothetical protein